MIVNPLKHTAWVNYDNVKYSQYAILYKHRSFHVGGLILNISSEIQIASVLVSNGIQASMAMLLLPRRTMLVQYEHEG